jgi:chemotaxis protein histidine kinase CheA
MTDAMPASPTGPLPLADRLLELAELFHAAIGQNLQSGALADIRLRVEELRAEAESLEMDPYSQALVRIGLLTEVWECLLGDQASSAGELGIFCVEATTQLARSVRAGEVGEDVALWIREQSSSTWGDYVVLLEPTDGSEHDRALSDLDLLAGDDSPTIDAQALLRLFTGCATDGESEVMAPSEPVTATRSMRTAELEPPALVIPALPARVDLDEEIREAFLADGIDLFDRIEPLVLGLSRAQPQSGSLEELGRCFHTLKGAAGSVGLTDLGNLVHTLEEHLEHAGDKASAGLIDLLHQTLGYMEGILSLLRTTTGPAGIEDRRSTEVNERAAIAQVIPATNPGQSSSATPALISAPAPAANSAAGQEAPVSVTTASSSAADGPVRIAGSRFDELMDIVSELIAKRRLWSTQAESMKSISRLVRNCRNRVLGSLDRLYEAGLGRDQAALVIESRADVPGQLRRLAEQADDLAVLAETAQSAAVPMADHGDALSRLTIQLWDELQAIRIVAIRGLFQRLIRVAHDAARVEGRQVEVVTVGEETGLDRAVQDKAFEPLLHVVRNAVGHGIELPSDRLKAGKAATGKVTLEARREGNTLVIAVSDDGRGLNHDAIAAKARRLGLLSADERPSVERLNNLIFHSGFSTKQDVSAISGRGVGMDVVASEVSLLKGTIELQTESGRGTRLTIRLPARLALETTMIVRVDGQAFALPVAQIDHAQPFEPDQETGQSRKKPGEQGVSFTQFRDRCIPVVQAREMLGITSTLAAEWPKLLVVRLGAGLIGLVVDAIEGTEELVIKSLGSLLAGHPVISGTGMSVTGEVISILNLSVLERWIGEGASNGSLGFSPLANQEGAVPGFAVLVVDDSISVRKVVARQLRVLGFDVDEVSDGLEALARLRSRAYGLVVTDLEMPRLDGFELVAEMRRMGVLATTPVVVASTRVDEGTRNRVLALGARAFLPKPVDPTALASTVGTLLQRVGG